MLVTCIDIYGKEHEAHKNDLINRKSVYGLFIADKHVLLMQDSLSKNWELPGGGGEFGETEQEALAREFLEETGVAPYGPISLLTNWEEYFYDVVSSQAWRSSRTVYKLTKMRSLDTLLKNGNGSDSIAAKMVPFDRIKLLPMQQVIKRTLYATICNYQSIK
jgi:8-oxo-dGTP pyrophosphatase MutT (NUDIX family)